MNQIAKTFANPASPEQHLIADLLLSIAPNSNFLVKHSDKNDYITLDEQTGNNKNAVAVHRYGTSFMVSDWSLEAKAITMGLNVRRVENKKVGKRLLFRGLNVTGISDHQSFSRMPY